MRSSAGHAPVIQNDPPYLKPPVVKPGPPAVKGDKGPKGEKGEVGSQGERGKRGRDAIVESIDYDALTAEVVKRLPPILVNTYDRDGNLVDDESYPYPGPIKIRYGYLVDE